MTDRDLTERLSDGLKPTIRAYLSGFLDEASELNHSPTYDLLADLAIESYRRLVCDNDARGLERANDSWTPIQNVIDCLASGEDSEIIAEIEENAWTRVIEYLGGMPDDRTFSDALNKALWRRLEQANLPERLKSTVAWHNRRKARLERVWAEFVPSTGEYRVLDGDECDALGVDGTGRFIDGPDPIKGHPWDRYEPGEEV